MTDIISLAKSYSRYGWQCFPLPPRNKVPAVKWADIATSDENVLVGWFDTMPAANIGITCGARSGIVVLDVDAAHGGYESLAAIQGVHGKLPETPVAKTGGGGEHIFFKHTGREIRNSSSRLAPGLDIRGDGGYVVGVPSVHPNGNLYEWVIDPDAVPLAPFPEWMADLLKDTPVKELPVATNGMIANGARNDTMAKMAGAMRRKGFDEDAIYQALLVENRKKCLPPLSDGEIYIIARSIARYVPSDPIEVAEVKTAESAIEELEADIVERQKNPKDVWGIHYTYWPYLSLVTGGKQKGELIILAGEPGVGKSWFAHQDALYTAMGSPSQNIDPIPTLLWSGEMRQKQTWRRMFEMLGVAKRRMLTGNMNETAWQRFNEAKATLMTSPLYIIDSALNIKDIPEMLKREIDEHGIEYVVFDYDWLISAKGDGEIETSQNISRAMKNAAHDLNISIMLISSVNKQGMGGARTHIANVSGSGKKLHDADIVFTLTKFDAEKNGDLSILPADYERIATLNFEKARDLDYHLPGGKLNFMRETPNPRFREMKTVTKPAWLEMDSAEDCAASWIERADIGD